MTSKDKYPKKDLKDQGKDLGKDLKDNAKDLKDPKETNSHKDNGGGKEPKNVSDKLCEQLKEGGEKFLDTSKHLKDTCKETYKNVADNVSNKVNSAFEASSGMIDRVKEPIQNVYENVKGKATQQMKDQKQAANQTVQDLEQKPPSDIIIETLTKIVAFIEYCMFLLATLGYKLVERFSGTNFGKWLISVFYPLFVDVYIRAQAFKQQSLNIIASGLHYIKKTSFKTICNDALHVTYEVGYWIIPTLLGQKPQPKIVASQDILQWIMAVLDLVFFFRPRRLPELISSP